MNPHGNFGYESKDEEIRCKEPDIRHYIFSMVKVTLN